MKKIISILLCCTLLCVQNGLSQQYNTAVQRFVDQPAFQHASIGISLVRLADGQELIDHQAQVALTPASTLKVITTATALSMLPDHFKMHTSVGYSGQVDANGVLQGDLIVRGEGDPSLASSYSLQKPDAFFAQVKQKLQSKGIRAVKGRIIADESHFSFEGVPSGWTWEDMGNYYAAGVYGINYADNLFRLTLDTRKKGQQPQVSSFTPTVDGLTIDNRLQSYSMPFDSAYLYGAPFSNVRTLYGAVPQKRETFTIKGDMPEPALQLAQNLRTYLSKSQIKMEVTCTTARKLSQAKQAVPSPAHNLLKFASDPLAHIAKKTNVHSINLYAEALLRQVAIQHNPRSLGSNQAGIDAVKQYWKKQGLSVSGLMMCDGSGLSPANRVTPRFLTSLLQKMQKDPAFVQSLPLVGQEGTVKYFLRSTPYAGKARMKSGSIGGVIAYTGYINNQYAWAILVNNATGSSSSVRKAIEKLLVNLNL